VGGVQQIFFIYLDKLHLTAANTERLPKKVEQFSLTSCYRQLTANEYYTTMLKQSV
jgi:hypothetical protein